LTPPTKPCIKLNAVAAINRLYSRNNFLKGYFVNQTIKEKVEKGS